MPESQAPLRAFTTKAPGIANRLLNEVTISHNSTNQKVVALWDTGATGTCISTDVVQQLGLTPTGMKNIQTPSGSSQVNTYLVDVLLPNNVKIADVEVCDSEIGKQHIGMLVGMDIINLGDFTVSNHSGKTVFSFRIPSTQTTDYVAQIKVQNIIGPKHGTGKRKKSKKR